MKKVICAILSATMAVAMFAGCGSSTPAPAPAPAPAETPAEEPAEEPAEAPAEAPAADQKFKVGVTIQSLANAYWAGVFGEVETIMKEKGWEYTIVDCKDNSSEQISQIENFIASGCDVIMVHPSDPNAIEDVCKQARDAGVRVMSWDDQMTNTDVNWVLDNTELGFAIGNEAAKFISEHYTADSPAEVAIMNYPQTPILLERENGILSALEEGASGLYTVVAQQPAIDAGAAQSHMETILQAYPNCKIVASIGAGGDVGANEAFMAATGGNIPDDMGIFSADATQQQLQAIIDGQATRATVGFEGSNLRTAQACVDLYERLLNGEEFPDRNIFRPLLPIDINNAQMYLDDY